MEYTPREFIDCHECGLSVPYDTLVDIDGDRYCDPCGTSILHLLAQEMGPLPTLHPASILSDGTSIIPYGPDLH